MSRKKWKSYLTITIILCSFLIPFQSASAVERTYLFYFGDYYYFYWTSIYGPPYYIDWSFSSSNSYVGIEVWVFDEDNFDLFHSGYSAYGYQLSDGGYYRASGEFTLPYDDYWYIVFIHLDEDIFEASYVTMRVELLYPYYNPYNPGDYSTGLPGWAIALIVVIPTVVLITVITTIVLVIRKKRKLRLQQTNVQSTAIESEVLPQQQPPSSKSSSIQPSPQQDKIIYCTNCGSPNQYEDNYCAKCGKALRKK